MKDPVDFADTDGNGGHGIQLGGRVWTGKFWLALIALALAPMVFAMAGCGGEPLAPTPVATATPLPPCQIIVNGDNVGIIVCSGGVVVTQPSPSPSASPAAAIGSVTMEGIVGGEHCTSGTPANLTKTIGVGCYLDATINPRDKNGKVIFDESVTGPAPDRFERRDSFAGATASQDAGNPFNFRITCTAAGTVVLSATVKGVSSGDVAFGCK